MKTKVYKRLVACFLLVLLLVNNGMVFATEGRESDKDEGEKKTALVELGDENGSNGDFVNEDLNLGQEQGTEDYRAVYNFYLEDGTFVTRMVYKDGDSLKNPGDPVDLLKLEGYDFKGWYLEDGSSLNFGETLRVDENREIKVLGRILASYHTVTFKYGDQVVATRKVAHGQCVSADNIHINYEQNDHKDYWAGPDGSPYDFKQELEGDLVLTLVVKSVIKLSFDSKGGSQVDPIYLEEGESLSRPKDPFRYGYVFKCWILAGDPEKKAYEFNQVPSEDTYLEALWEDPENISYSIYHMVEGLEEGKYLIKNIEKIENGRQNEEVLAKDKETVIKGFSPDTSYNENSKLIVRSDENNELIVRYKRNSYKFTMKLDDEKLVEEDVKYEESTSKAWEQANSNLDKDKNYSWKESVADGSARYLEAPSMPDKDLTILAYEVKEKVSYKRFIDIESGENIFVFAFYENNALNVGSKDIPGYSWVYSEGGAELDSKEPTTSYEKRDKLFPFKYEGIEDKELRCYYIKDIYSVNLQSKYGEKNKFIDIKFSNSLEDNEELVAYINDFEKAYGETGYMVGETRYKFLGWYEDKLEDSSPFNLEGKTMPEGNLVLFARWKLDDLKIRIHASINDGLSQAEERIVSYGTSLKDLSLREEANFKGWYGRQNGKYVKLNENYVFYKDMDIYPVYGGESYRISYDYGDYGKLEKDPNSYVFNAMAVLRKGLQVEGKVFIGWMDEEDNRLYYGGDSIEINKNLILKACYADPNKTSLVSYKIDGEIRQEDLTYNQEVYVIRSLDGFEDIDLETRYFSHWILDDKEYRSNKLIIDSSRTYCLEAVFKSKEEGGQEHPGSESGHELPGGGGGSEGGHELPGGGGESGGSQELPGSGGENNKPNLSDKLYIEVSVEWHDSDDIDGLRPEFVKIFFDEDMMVLRNRVLLGRMHREEEIRSEEGWNHTFELDRLIDGRPAKYKVEEGLLTGYSCEIIYEDENKVRIINTKLLDESGGEAEEEVKPGIDGEDKDKDKDKDKEENLDGEKNPGPDGEKEDLNPEVDKDKDLEEVIDDLENPEEVNKIDPDKPDENTYEKEDEKPESKEEENWEDSFEKEEDNREEKIEDEKKDKDEDKGGEDGESYHGQDEEDYDLNYDDLSLEKIPGDIREDGKRDDKKAGLTKAGGRSPKTSDIGLAGSFLGLFLGLPILGFLRRKRKD